MSPANPPSSDTRKRTRVLSQSGTRTSRRMASSPPSESASRASVGASRASVGTSRVSVGASRASVGASRRLSNVDKSLQAAAMCIMSECAQLREMTAIVAGLRELGPRMTEKDADKAVTAMREIAAKARGLPTCVAEKCLEKVRVAAEAMVDEVYNVLSNMRPEDPGTKKKLELALKTLVR